MGAVRMRLKEAGYMSKSISMLNSVINALVEISNDKLRCMHYPDCRHTFLLKVCSCAQCVPGCDHANSTLITPQLFLSSYLLLFKKIRLNFALV
jgi:hypothetical protein